MPGSTWSMCGVHSRSTRAELDHGCPLPLYWLYLLNPLTSWELEEKPSSLRLALSLVVGLSAEATGPISLWAPLWVSFCFLASFLWDMCKGKNHSQMVAVALKHWEDRLFFPNPHPQPPNLVHSPEKESRQKKTMNGFRLLRNRRLTLLPHPRQCVCSMFEPKMGNQWDSYNAPPTLLSEEINKTCIPFPKSPFRGRKWLDWPFCFCGSEWN